MTNDRIVVGIFQDQQAAQKAIADLEHAGFEANDVGYAIRGKQVMSNEPPNDRPKIDSDGVKAGALSGGAAGTALGIVGALATAVIPGVGPVLAGGILLSALGFGVAGTAVGSIVGAMLSMGVEEKHAVRYEKEFNSGKAIVTVRPSGRDSQARGILQANGAYEIDEEVADPLTSEQT
jgi:hypothetical protein